MWNLLNYSYYLKFSMHLIIIIINRREYCIIIIIIIFYNNLAQYAIINFANFCENPQEIQLQLCLLNNSLNCFTEWEICCVESIEFHFIEIFPININNIYSVFFLTNLIEQFSCRFLSKMKSFPFWVKFEWNLKFTQFYWNILNSILSSLKLKKKDNSEKKTREEQKQESKNTNQQVVWWGEGKRIIIHNDN